ncbi:hypothetical protein JW711_00235 [Candidatus Woesearchaeota archaeon]|nr:hypothetical protein [Candidatus Woesearchaeota archaeon]
MKHDFKVTLFLIAIFVVAQLVGLLLLSSALKEQVDEQGNRVVVFDESKVGEIPQMSGLGFLVYITLGVGIGTGLVLLLARFKRVNLWRIWFFLAVFIAIDFALKTVMPWAFAFFIAFILATWKIARPNVVVHNLSEILMYSGISVFLVPLLNSMQNSDVLGIPGNIFWASLILVLISVYDFIAVFQSKHMVSMANFQTKSKVFAGLLIPYKAKAIEGAKELKASLKKAAAAASKSLKSPVQRMKQKLPRRFPDVKQPVDGERRTAILGGGDIAFPMLFIGTVMYHLANKMPIQLALLESFIIVGTATAALATLFIVAKKDKFYPAMPILSAGCFVGYLIVLLI